MATTANVLDSPALPLLLDLEHRGLTVELGNEEILVSPSDRLTDELRTLLREHATPLAALLRVCDSDVQDRRAGVRGGVERAVPGGHALYLRRVLLVR